MRSSTSAAVSASKTSSSWLRRWRRTAVVGEFRQRSAPSGRRSVDEFRQRLREILSPRRVVVVVRKPTARLVVWWWRWWHCPGCRWSSVGLVVALMLGRRMMGSEHDDHDDVAGAGAALGGCPGGCRRARGGRQGPAGWWVTVAAGDLPRRPDCPGGPAGR